MKIQGTVKEMKRVHVKCPDDSVHRVSNKNGWMKGCRSVMLNDTELLPRGMSGLYRRYKEDYGIKVFYSVHNDVCSKRKIVLKQFKRQNKLYKLGVATQPHKIVSVRMDFKYYGKDGKYVRHVKKTALGIKVTHVAYPEEVWEKYAQGYPYDWNGDDHEDHSPEGYLKFCKRLKKVLKKSGIGICGQFPFKEKKNPKLGDIVWDCKDKRFYIVDVGD